MSFPSATAASLDPSEPPCVLDEPSIHFIGAAGILRYSRESDDHRLNLTTVPPASQPPSAGCEYCGGKAEPSLDLTWVEELQVVPAFCCIQRRQLFKTLVELRCLVQGRRCPGIEILSMEEENPTTELEELLFQGREMEDPNKFLVNLAKGLREQSELRLMEDSSAQLPTAETFAAASKVLSFRLSCAPGKRCWEKDSSHTHENRLKVKVEQVSVPVCDHEAFQFGLCHHQAGGAFLQKHYSNGTTFLTLFPDGSAQVFYPSGLLALVIVVTEDNGRVCVVYDDSHAPDRPIRALFQSDGRATCYHSNGNIWLTLDRSGGQYLDVTGARLRRWTWIWTRTRTSLSVSPTPLLPVFLSLNKTVGVRVLGKEQVFVSFLARGQQAKFSVGTCCVQCKCSSDGPVSRPSGVNEELLVLAARIKIQNLTNPRLPKTRLSPKPPKIWKSTAK